MALLSALYDVVVIENVISKLPRSLLYYWRNLECMKTFFRENDNIFVAISEVRHSLSFETGFSSKIIIKGKFFITDREKSITYQKFDF